MEDNKLSKRLERAASYIRVQDFLADIGSDHAYLPCELVENNRCKAAIAGEVVKGPYERAQKEVARRGLGDQVDVRLGDGLEVIQPNDSVTAISICGMGGTLITQILDEGFRKNQLRGNERLILQPNVGEHILRSWLNKHQYIILAEEILEENAKVYEIIVAEKKGESNFHRYTNLDIQYGPFLRKECSDLFKRKWEAEFEKIKYVLNQLQHSQKDQSEKIRGLKEKQEEIKEVLKCQS